MKNVIYKIRNVVNEHYYIGSTVDSRKRFWEHRKDLRLGKHVCVRLQRAWNKYGEDCFKFEIVEQLNSREELYPTEQRWLNDHHGTEYCYNVAAHADAPMRDASPEMRARLAEKTKAWLEREGHPRQGEKHLPETLSLISKNRKGKAAGPDHYRYGKTVSPEVRAKIGATQRGKPKAPGRKISAEGMAKIRAAAAAGHFSHWKNRKHTEETKAKMSKTVFVMPDGILFPSLTSVLQYYDIKMPTLNRALKSGKPLSKGKLAGYEFSYGGVGATPTENDLALIRAKLLDTPHKQE
jgi:group I intron endonuclease